MHGLMPFSIQPASQKQASKLCLDQCQPHLSFSAILNPTNISKVASKTTPSMSTASLIPSLK